MSILDDAAEEHGVVTGLWAVVACSSIGAGGYACLDAHPHIKYEMDEGGHTIEDWFYNESLPSDGIWRWEGSCTYFPDGETVLKGKWEKEDQNEHA